MKTANLLSKIKKCFDFNTKKMMRFLSEVELTEYEKNFYLALEKKESYLCWFRAHKRSLDISLYWAPEYWRERKIWYIAGFYDEEFEMDALGYDPAKKSICVISNLMSYNDNLDPYLIEYCDLTLERFFKQLRQPKA